MADANRKGSFPQGTEESGTSNILDNDEKNRQEVGEDGEMHDQARAERSSSEGNSLPDQHSAHHGPTPEARFIHSQFLEQQQHHQYDEQDHNQIKEHHRTNAKELGGTKTGRGLFQPNPGKYQ